MFEMSAIVLSCLVDLCYKILVPLEGPSSGHADVAPVMIRFVLQYAVETVGNVVASILEEYHGISVLTVLPGSGGRRPRPPPPSSSLSASSSSLHFVPLDTLEASDQAPSTTVSVEISTLQPLSALSDDPIDSRPDILSLPPSSSLLSSSSSSSSLPSSLHKVNETSSSLATDTSLPADDTRPPPPFFMPGPPLSSSLTSSSPSPPPSSEHDPAPSLSPPPPPPLPVRAISRGGVTSC
eukprot:TRINITY_DN2892_c0_g1_i5.p3 TRINITY_DN2892_c0_g1~~TRINITY_DN2892_c0_g1_i5.p3  ORF type:complete len:238 (+),score=73.12 TRINITY_DN2892_c0_g1_i5:2974-3687(+)